MKTGNQRRQDALIEGYQAQLERTRRMLEFARAGSWAALIEEEILYMVEVERLGELEGGSAFGAATLEQRAELLEGILENSLEIKRCLAARHAVLERRCQAERDFEPALQNGNEHSAWSSPRRADDRREDSAIRVGLAGKSRRPLEKEPR